MKKRIKVIIIIAVVVAILLGVFSLAKVIVGNGYSSLEVVQEEAEKREEEIKAPEVTETPKEDEGVHGFLSDDEIQEIADNENIPTYVARINYILTEPDSPYVDYKLDYIESDLENGEKVISILDRETEEKLVDVYCNSVDYGSYMYVKNTEFTEEENTFYKNMGNGETGERDGKYYWFFY